jgi:ribosomal protein S18 acetylase RimI-like enzyme
VRTGTTTDIPALLTLINRAFDVERAFKDADRTTEADLRERMTTGHFVILDGEKSAAGEPDACAWIDLRNAPRGYMGMLAVRPGLQGKGIGKTMMAAIEQHLRDHGCTHCDIRVVNLRTELPPFYRKLGYVETGTSPFDDPAATKTAHFVLMEKALG